MLCGTSTTTLTCSSERPLISGAPDPAANAVGWNNKPVEVTFTQAEDGMAITVRDYGSGFAPEDIPDPTNPENLLKANGRGILFMRSFMDEVEWDNPPGGGMKVKMVKKRN